MDIHAARTAVYSFHSSPPAAGRRTLRKKLVFPYRASHPAAGASLLCSLNAFRATFTNSLALPDRTQPQSPGAYRSEEHTSELQSLRHLVCRLLLEKKKRSRSCWPQPSSTSFEADSAVSVWNNLGWCGASTCCGALPPALAGPPLFFF